MVIDEPGGEVASAVAALDAIAPLLAHDDAVVRAGTAYLLGRVGQADAALAPTVRAKLVEAAQDEIDDSVIRALAAAVSAARLSVDEANGLMRLAPTLRRIGVYHLAMVASAAPGGRAGARGAGGGRRRPRSPGALVGRLRPRHVRGRRRPPELTDRQTRSSRPPPGRRKKGSFQEWVMSSVASMWMPASTATSHQPSWIR